ncbi:ribose-phosphate diphosphokinase [Colwellia sp. MB3u-70]|uniref:ribose-phosphate diphosphokinase n=1 Tax=unclassified Colwellia TaxID=196834 RepID=UPI0015F4135F|nr:MULTISPECIES: ribose-phosphate diphosphokinase [unclassified Colwellia]MBA6291273.1 ribose-phosphate diphosphokinase [Colwellia sp. MB3u-8]MBA6307311.1 ribose-phosphate diphosphokinase [Colwellia sp. MB3u-70]
MTLILGFDDYLLPAQQLAKSLSAAFKQVELHQFPDGETKVTLPTTLPKHIIICRTLNNPNAKITELIITAAAARNQGVKHITLVAPYLCYMRQDMAFNPGEAVSQKIMGNLLAAYFDSVITIDPHLHRINNLSEAIPITQACALHATGAMSQFLQQHFSQPVLIGPDEESEQWVKAIAQPHQWPYVIAKKARFGDKNVAVSLNTQDKNNIKAVSLSNRDVIIVDDIASTGKTLEQAVKQIQQQSPMSISIIVTHAFFVDNALTRLKDMGVTNIWSSDSVLHSTNAFSIIDTLARQLKKMNITD